jgi:RNA polymerase sigma factor (sigma-70 family)
VALRETRRMLGNGPDAPDAAQEAMLRAYRARSRCLTPEAPQAWVRAIARREALRLIAHRPGLEALAPGLEDQPAPGSEDAQRVLDRLTAQSALAQVEAADRALLLRRYVLDQTSREIAAELAISPATVRVRLHRAIKAVRQIND